MYHRVWNMRFLRLAGLQENYATLWYSQGTPFMHTAFSAVRLLLKTRRNPALQFLLKIQQSAAARRAPLGGGHGAVANKTRPHEAAISGCAIAYREASVLCTHPCPLQCGSRSISPPGHELGSLRRRTLLRMPNKVNSRGHLSCYYFIFRLAKSLVCWLA